MLLSILLTKICSISKTSFTVTASHQKSIFIVTRVSLIHICFEAAHSFPPLILVSITQLHFPFWESAGKEQRKKAVTHPSLDHVLPIKNNTGLERHPGLPAPTFKQ